MAIDVSALVNYIKEDENLLITRSLFGARTAEIIMKEGNVMTGVKFAEKINILATDAIFQSGDGCTRVSSGSTTITQRQVTVGAVAVIEDICVKTLNKTYLAKKMVQGSMPNKLPFEQEYGDLKARTIAKQIEIALWQGDTTSANANLNRFDGFIKLIDAAGTAVLSNTSAYNGQAGPIAVATGITTANVKGVVGSMWGALPSDIQGQDDVRIFCGWDTFQKFIQSYTDQNLFNFKPDGNEVSAAIGVVVIPGTNYKLTAVHGLDNTNRLFAIRTSNMFLGVDLENEEEKFQIIPDQFNDFLRFKVEFKEGVNVAFPDQIVSFKLV